MNIKSLNPLWLAVPAICTLSACGPQQLVQAPSFQVLSSQLQGVELLGVENALANSLFDSLLNNNLTVSTKGLQARITMRTQVKIHNPNPLGVNLSSIQGRMFMDNTFITAVTLPNVSLPANGDTIQNVDLSFIVNENLVDRFRSIAQGNRSLSAYTIDGSFSVAAGPLNVGFGPYLLMNGQLLP